MDAHFQDFRTAYYNRRGDLLASTLSPTPSPHYPTRLEAFYNQTNAWEVNGDIRYYVSKDNSALNIKAAEANSWAEVYIIYWKALGVILALQQQRGGGEQVKLYEIWKEFANALHRGYTHGGFEAWTVPCLYVVSKWLRIFAIRADRESKAEGGGGSLRTDDLLEDGFATGMGNNEKLEDAARVINKVFQLCISDRYVDTMQCPSMHDLPVHAESAAESHPGHLCSSPANGGFTISSTFFSRHISRSFPQPLIPPFSPFLLIHFPYSLPAQLNLSLQKHSPCPQRLPHRNARPDLLSQIPYRHIQILCRRHLLP